MASYNVHRCRGRDGRRDPGRIAAVLDEMKVDVVGLQEVDSRAGVEHGVDQLQALADASGFLPLAGPTLRRHDGEYGNGLLTRLPVVSHRLLDLSVPGREPRGAIDAVLEVDGSQLRIVVTHFGLRGAERRAQSIRLMSALEAAPGEDPDATTVVMGDLNEWLPRARSLRHLGRSFSPPRGVRSFPAVWPLLALDRVSVRPAQALLELRAHASPLARMASDHLPVRAVIRLGGS